MDRAFFFFFLAGLSVLIPGCSSVPIEDSGYRGLFDRWAPYAVGSDHGKDRADSKLIRETAGKTQDWTTPLSEMVITSPYGKRGRRFHDGVDLKASVGTPVFAVDNGDVIYSGRKISGYGNMVVVKHRSGLMTIYAHHSKNLVHYGQKVKKGDKIALSGRSGQVTGPHLHFEIRKGVVSIDPVQVLSSQRSFAQR